MARRYGIPGVYWANFFGPIYVRLFGREKFLTVPAYQREEMPNGSFLLLTSASPVHYTYPKARAFERAIVDHLGQHAFFEKKRPQKAILAPRFSFEQITRKETPNVVAFDPISRVIPDVKAFTNDALRKAEALSLRFANGMDYSPRSLNQIDRFIPDQPCKVGETWDNEGERELVQLLTAYYGEVLRRYFGGEWRIAAGSGGKLHPVVAFRMNRAEQVEYVFTRIIKLWSERESGDALAVRFQVFLIS